MDSHLIKVATSEDSLKSYNLTETDVNSGIFTAEVTLTGFAHDADGWGIDPLPRMIGDGPTGGFLELMETLQSLLRLNLQMELYWLNQFR